MIDWRLFRRFWRFWWQRRTRGWDDSETWNLDTHAARFLLPRLRRFKEVTLCHPHGLTEESWQAVLDDMIYALDVCVRDGDGVVPDADWGRVDRGLRALGEYWRDLWW